MYIISKYLGIYAILHVYLTKTYKSSYFIAISNCYLHKKKKKKLIVAIRASDRYDPNSDTWSLRYIARYSGRYSRY
ncbi:hypothetical protein HanPSC8_Chr09g0375921 [Helianthus annuus]|nr:hypothetical protein HanPSC8_Chr09g0375921 [Helianthus annuus]